MARRFVEIAGEMPVYIGDVGGVGGRPEVVPVLVDAIFTYDADVAELLEERLNEQQALQPSEGGSAASRAMAQWDASEAIIAMVFPPKEVAPVAGGTPGYFRDAYRVAVRVKRGNFVENLTQGPWPYRVGRGVADWDKVGMGGFGDNGEDDSAVQLMTTRVRLVIEQLKHMLPDDLYGAPYWWPRDSRGHKQQRYPPKWADVLNQNEDAPLFNAIRGTMRHNYFGSWVSQKQKQQAVRLAKAPSSVDLNLGEVLAVAQLWSYAVGLYADISHLTVNVQSDGSLDPDMSPEAAASVQDPVVLAPRVVDMTRLVLVAKGKQGPRTIALTPRAKRWFNATTVGQRILADVSGAASDARKLMAKKDYGRSSVMRWELGHSQITNRLLYQLDGWMNGDNRAAVTEYTEYIYASQSSSGFFPEQVKALATASRSVNEVLTLVRDRDDRVFNVETMALVLALSLIWGRGGSRKRGVHVIHDSYIALVAMKDHELVNAWASDGGAFICEHSWAEFKREYMSGTWVGPRGDGQTLHINDELLLLLVYAGVLRARCSDIGDIPGLFRDPGFFGLRR